MNTVVVCTNCEKLNRVSLEKASSAQAVCGSCKSSLPIHDGVQEVTGSSLAKLLRSVDRPVVVDFWAPWCGPCKSFAPVYSQAARQFGDRIIFAKLDSQLHQLAAEAYQIRGLPTLVVFRNGLEIERVSGALPQPVLLEFLSRIAPSSKAA
jgi:thioredoxin 2